jgi:glyoxylase-like metal-dependent hydrolase (beta-lactamase superfamily II)
MAKLHVFRVGHCTHPACMALKGAGLGSRCFPSRAYLIETRQGPVVWDTGYAERFHDATAQGIYRLYPLITPVYFDPQESLVNQLRTLGLAAHDVKTLVMSHFHADHIAGVRDFPSAQLLASGAGWSAVRGLHGLQAVRQAFIPALLPPDIEQRLSFVEGLPVVKLPPECLPFTEGFDVTGDGEMLIVALPGHAVGHLGAFVRQDSGWTLLASDAAWATDCYRSLRGPSELSFLIQHNRAAYYRTLHQLHMLHQAGHVRIELTHEEPQ